MNKKPIIALSGSITVEEKGTFLGNRRCYVSEDYVTSVIKSNGSPFIIPINTDDSTIENLVNICDGIIITGGYDVDPRFYNQDPHYKLQDTLIERDIFEIKLINIALKLNKPIFGICRGLQILNVCLNGSLYQDNSLKEGSFIKHVQQANKNVATHEIKIEKNSILYNIFKEKTFVNSFHHMSIKDISNEFKVTAYSNDGIIEAIEHKTRNNVFAVQWHPEMLHDNEKQLEIFNTFIKMCQK